MNAADRDDIRVMIADDSAIVRGLITRMIESEPGASVVESVANGKLAVRALARRHDIDVVILDIEMPEMDGLAALPEILKLQPGLPVIMASTLTQRNAAISLEALEAGAADYIPKPTAGGLTNQQGFRDELMRKIAALGGAWRRKNDRRPAPSATPGAVMAARPAAPALPTTSDPVTPTLRPAGKYRPKVICIGCSTGGPQALLSVLQALPPSVIRQPILITQHMPAAFTKILAERISRSSQWQCAEAASGDTLRPDHALLAPGDYHMIVVQESGTARIRLTRDPPVNFCRPAVDLTFDSARRVFGGRVLAVVLTGMGSDGREGGRRIVAEGGTIIAQDTTTSVVWGMPGAVASAGLCSAIVPIDEIPRSIASFANGGHA